MLKRLQQNIRKLLSLRESADPFLNVRVDGSIRLRWIHTLTTGVGCGCLFARVSDCMIVCLSADGRAPTDSVLSVPWQSRVAATAHSMKSLWSAMAECQFMSMATSRIWRGTRIGTRIRTQNGNRCETRAEFVSEPVAEPSTEPRDGSRRNTIVGVK